MAQATFHAPRRKRKVYESYESPFPIPLSHDCYMKDFRICEAEMINNYVIVRRLEDIELLYGKGYFGKGILSRSRPEYNVAQNELSVRWKASQRKFPIISSRKYQRHIEWAKGLLEGQGLGTRVISKILGDYTHPINQPEETPTDPVDHKPDLPPASAEAAFLAREENMASEGNPVYDPLAKYDTKELENPDICTESDEQVPGKTHCHRHDDFIIHCGCKPEKQTIGKEAVMQSMNDGDEHEYVLVEETEPDSGAEDEDLQAERGKMKKNRLVCRRNPFRIFEYLQLSREEAFFLVYALGCLSVSYKKEPLPIQKLWEVFSEVQKNFPTTYMAYQHFRSKGWVPKVGLKYGTDLLLYRKGPPFYHASYSVIVELVDESFEGHSPLRPLTWRSLSGVNRTTMNVSKELLICYLIKPPGFTEKDINTPQCIKTFNIQEVIVSRWISSRERMEHEDL